MTEPSQEVSTTGDTSTYVLVPGMGCGSWTWWPVARLLNAHGHRALPLTMPGMDPAQPDTEVGLEDAVDHIMEKVETTAVGPVRLVAHSWGGIPVTSAATRLGADRVREVIYCGAVVPEIGRSMAEENPDLAAIIYEALRQGPTIPIDFDSFSGGMMQDEPEPVQRVVHSLMVDTPGRYFTDPPRSPGVVTAGIPARYLLGDDDQALARPGAEFAARIDLVPERVPGSHMALVTKPGPIATSILRSV